MSPASPQSIRPPRHGGWRRLRAAALLFTAALAAGCGVETPLLMEVGVDLPAFTLPSLDGVEVSSASFGQRGEVTVLNFWATWCQPCLKEIPELAATAEDPRVRVVGVALDEEGAATVMPFAERHGIDFTILLGDQAVFQRLGGHTIPYTLVLDAGRQVVNIYRGPTTGEQLALDIAQASDADR